MTFSFEKAAPNEFESIRAFYWDLIDSMRQDGKGDNIGWKKGIYPTDEYLKDSLADGTLFTLKDENELCGCVILNSTANEGYNGIKWSKALADSEILIPHALAVTPHRQGQGIGKCFMAKIFDFARESGKKAMRLDISGNQYRRRKALHKRRFPVCRDQKAVLRGYRTYRIQNV